MNNVHGIPSLVALSLLSVFGQPSFVTSKDMSFLIRNDHCLVSPAFDYIT